MSYMIPQPHRCIKCGYERKYGQDDPWPAPVTGDYVACPMCWELWLLRNIGEMRPIVQDE